MAAKLEFLVLCALLSLPGSANPEPSVVSPARVGTGSLLFRSNLVAGYVPAPTIATDVQIRITGLVGRTKVRQKFENHTTEWQEGVYVFPLPERAAVDALRMHVGERIIEGEIREREEARRTYEQAKQEGKKASLVEQERPNLFTTSIAQIGPGETIEVEIEYQEDIRYDHGTFELRFPLVVGPRYIPGFPEPPVSDRIEGFNGTGWAAPTKAVPDADRITPPVLHPSAERINPVELQVELDPGLALANVESPSHPVRVEPGEGHRRILRPESGTVPATKDFVLRWTPEVAEAPKAALFTEMLDGELYALLMLVPPQSNSKSRLPRETIFIIDTSGSMHGSSIEQAREALSLALDRLEPSDRFNVIQFNSVTSVLFPNVVPADVTNVGRARDYVRALRADGGTEMMPALEAAFSQGSEEGSEWVRQIVFITDGAVGNEDQLFASIQQGLGDRRLFTVGIGSAPNSYFMSGAARFGRGTFTYVGSTHEVAEKMGELFQKIESPVLSHIEVDFDSGVEMWPENVPDLYAGEPLVVTARLEKLAGEVVVRGRRSEQPWEVSFPLRGGASQSGVEKLWARRKIAALMDSAVEGVDAEVIRAGVVEVALRHHLVSKFTSLVAVDVTPTSETATPATRAVPTRLPEGWTEQKVVGTLAQAGTEADLLALAGILALLLGVLFYLGSPRCRRERPSASF
jgi:Ca-activated chloride channel family protein